MQNMLNMSKNMLQLNLIPAAGTTAAPPPLSPKPAADTPLGTLAPFPPPPPAFVGPAAAAVLPPPPPPLPPAPAVAAPAGAVEPARPVQPPRPLSDFSAPGWAALDSVDLLREFALDCPTLRFVLKAARAAAADVTEELLRTTLRAERSTLNEVHAWKLARR